MSHDKEPAAPKKDVTKDAEADDMADMIAYALWRKWKLRPRKRDLAATRAWARHVVAHLRLCGVEWNRRPPRKLHSSADYMTPPSGDPGER